ncbi:Hypothetical predicted protein [Mytilus galloprovincialis]|uniref:Tyr recombinase domain-containing protein n=1 Tax=Mytilus galloprovincialis TaxID=29158 RepID=A0A8B6CJ56_MYTGA|nr:Hypothetical predicted protein [Mytilus galloprovincialis]
MLIALTNAARAQSIHLMNVNHVHKVKGEFIFVLNELVKQSRPGYKEPTVNIKAYPPDRRLCVYTVYKEYVFRTKLFRGKHEPLLLSYVKPHQPVSRDTISRWIKVVMAKANIDTTIFKAHSVRSASVSKAKMNAVPISRILQKAGWRFIPRQNVPQMNPQQGPQHPSTDQGPQQPPCDQCPPMSVPVNNNRTMSKNSIGSILPQNTNTTGQ